ncbi:MAG: hypothetical protein ACFKPT_02490 [Gloeotrichia echinulata GP01]
MTQNVKPWNPYEIQPPTGYCIDEDEVTAVLEKFSNNDNIPDIVVTKDGKLLEGINVLEAAKRLEQEMVMVVIREEISESIFTSISTELLYSHPLNASIYGENEDLSALKVAITETGWIKTLLVTPDGNGKYKILSGNSCFKVGRELGRKEFAVELRIFNNEQEELRALLAGNVGREKTIEQKVREGQLWEKIEREEAKARQGRAGLGVGTVRDRVAKKVGLGSGVNYEHAVAAVKLLDESADAPEGTARHQQHQALKQILSKPRGVDAAYKLVKSDKPSEVQRWTPKQFDRVRITGGEHKNKNATVRVITGAFCAICHVDGTPDEKRYQIAFQQMEALVVEERKPIASVNQELKQRQKSLGLGIASQVLPSINSNDAKPEEQQQASAVNLNLNGDTLIGEVVIALMRLTPEQLNQAIVQASANWDKSQIEACYQALHQQMRVA